jgi:hypothetical protein
VELRRRRAQKPCCTAVATKRDPFTYFTEAGGRTQQAPLRRHRPNLDAAPETEIAGGARRTVKYISEQPCRNATARA